MEKKVAKTIDNLLDLKQGYVRAVHLTTAEIAKKIADSGLNYETQGMLSSTARWWNNEKKVEYLSNDLRFQGEHMRAIVMDIPQEEARLHDNITKSPGLVPSKYIVGIIKPYKSKKKGE